MSGYEPSPAERFFAKVESEGSFYAALEYGLRSDTFDIPTPMAALWDVIRELYDELDQQLEEFAAVWDPNQ